MLNVVLGILPALYEFWRRFVEVDMKRAELSNVLQEVVSQAEDMNQKAKMEELEPGKKRKRVLDSYLNQAEEYKRFTQVVLDRSQEGQWMLKRMRWVPSIERHLKEGQGILSKGRQLLEQGLTYDEVRMRGEKLPLEENQYIGETVRGLFNRALRVLRDGSVQCIGIYGHAGAGKTNLMKRLYNEIFEDQEGFKAVFWC
ncbi:putative disease resistance protein At5g05400 [Beta vulgaris subsp. vulgaris]|uniref:putative disease resistance protein At5g05400 n=1 Tax=Beta vulgaris subsp. vulgaris TaxID=3555 RepID=UPI000901C425|nr:putative disease resistance protein At5g05400 [Beta vulgaris subsp. vulgaris]